MSFGLALQRLPNASSKVLVVCQLAGAQRGDGWFSTADVGLIFETFRVPAPSRIDNEITGLRSKGLLLRRSRKLSWSVTPEGSELVTALMGILIPPRCLASLRPLPALSLVTSSTPSYRLGWRRLDGKQLSSRCCATMSSTATCSA